MQIAGFPTHLLPPLQEVKPQGLFSAKLSKTVSSPVNTQGQTFNYTLTVTNNALTGDSSSAATIYNIVITDNFPLGIAPTKKHWVKKGSANSSCSFTRVESRSVRCSIARLLADEEVNIILEAAADGKNFAGKAAAQEVLANTASMTCSGNKTATAPDASCSRSSSANTTVSGGDDVCMCHAAAVLGFKQQWMG